MTRAHRHPFLGIEVALAQRPVVVGAPVLQGTVAPTEISPAWTIFTVPGGSSSTGATSISAMS